MEAGLAAAYGAETAVQGAAAAAFGVARATMPLKAKWTRISSDVSLPRSSHSLSVIKGRAFVFGGEEKPRQPVDNDIHAFTLPSSEVDSQADYIHYPAVGKDNGEVPAPRLGHTASVIDDRIYVFGGRGGKDMKPLEENGRVWVYDTMSKHWSFLDPVKGSMFPAPRSYHAAAATEYPLAAPNMKAEVQLGPTEPDAHGTIFIHGGCPGSGREADVWAFDVASATWRQFPPAPGPPRGGASLCFTRNRLYRYGGFDGKVELGGKIDYLDIIVSTHDDHSGTGEVAVTPMNDKWETIDVPEDDKAPGSRSVAGLQAVTTGQGRNYLILFLGEAKPSSAGHEAAGEYWDDVWSFQIRPDGMTAASFKDAARQMVGAKTRESTWAPVEVPQSSTSEGVADSPGARGWFASAAGGDFGAEKIVLWGGVKEDNSRAGDGWVLAFDV